jgi:hypothetical protein
LIIAGALFVVGTAVLINLRSTPEVPVEDPLGPYGLPRVIAIGLVLVAVLLASRAWWAAVRRPAGAAPSAAPVPAAAASATGDGVVDAAAVPTVEGAPADVSSQPRRTLGALTMAATIGYVLVLPTLGFVIASVLLGVVLLPLLGSRNLRVVVGIPAAVVALLWLLFVHTLEVNLPTFLGR